MWFLWYYQVYNAKPSILNHIVSVQIIKLDKNYQNFKQGGYEIEALPAPSEFFNRNAIRQSSHQKLSPIDAMLKSKAIHINNLMKPQELHIE